MADDKKPAEAPAKSGGGASMILGLILPALVAGAASFGGTKLAAGHAAAAPGPAASSATAEAKAPGPTLALEPFLLTVPDANKKPHPMKVTIAVEFEATTAKGEEGDGFKGLIPRIRDSALGYLRTLTYEEVIDPADGEKMRSDLLAHAVEAGAKGAQRVLITDFVVQ